MGQKAAQRGGKRSGEWTKDKKRDDHHRPCPNNHVMLPRKELGRVEATASRDPKIVHKTRTERAVEAGGHQNAGRAQGPSQLLVGLANLLGIDSPAPTEQGHRQQDTQALRRRTTMRAQEGGMGKNPAKDYYPWVGGGLNAACVCVAWGGGSRNLQPSTSCVCGQVCVLCARAWLGSGKGEQRLARGTTTQLSEDARLEKKKKARRAVHDVLTRSPSLADKMRLVPTVPQLPTPNTFLPVNVQRFLQGLFARNQKRRRTRVARWVAMGVPVRLHHCVRLAAHRVARRAALLPAIFA